MGEEEFKRFWREHGLPECLAWERHVQRAAGVFLLLMSLVAVYAVLAAVGVLPAAPWSPIGQAG